MGKIAAFCIQGGGGGGGGGGGDGCEVGTHSALVAPEWYSTCG